MKQRIILLAGISFVVAACSTQKPESLVNVETALDRAKNDNFVMQNAPLKLREAEKQVEAAEQAWKTDQDEEKVQYLSEEAFASIAEARTLAGESAVAELKREEKITNELLDKDKQLRVAENKATVYQEVATEYKARAQDIAEENRRLQGKLEDLQDTENIKIVLESDLLFDTNEDELKPGGKGRLEPVAGYLKSHAGRQVSVAGHTDAIGDAEYNQELSTQRAQAVKQYLMELGVASDQVKVHGAGETQPLASNDTAAGRLQNRRVEIMIEPKMAG